jgi:hypothetical protein
METQGTWLRIKGNKVGGKGPMLRVQKLRFDESMYWTVCHCQFESVVKHNNWNEQEKATHLLAILQGPATNVEPSIPAKVKYNTTLMGLRAVTGTNCCSQSILPN